MPAFDAAALVSSFCAAGAWIDQEAMDIVPFDGMGWGAVAKRRIEAHSPLFHIPPAYLLTPWTSTLRTHLTGEEWDALEGGWARLILCMMWEESRGVASPWSGYLANMPREFDSPMFWGDDDRAGLKGTDIEDRIGREDAEAEYNAKLAPLIAARPDVFPAPSGCFGIEQFHVQGSRILSRSFTVPITRAGGPLPEAEEDEDGDEEEEPEVAVMVPMADMLNAAYERDNARLYADGEDDEEDEDSEDEEDMGAAEEKRKALSAAKRFGEGYTMITTKAIEAGEQIYNTYASPPNSELLRKYGHVDTLDLSPELLGQLLPEEIGTYPFGNAGDEVEISGDLLVDAAVSAGHLAREGKDGATTRVDWWLDEGQADTFSITFPSGPPLSVVPPALWAFARLLTREEDWARAKRGKLPKPKDDDPVSIQLILAAIKARAAKYPQTFEADFVIVKDTAQRLNIRNAAAVRIGEKRVLALAARNLQKELDGSKRKSASQDKASRKRSKK